MNDVQSALAAARRHLRLMATISFFFFFNDTATTEIYTLSLHDALPISILCVRTYRRFFTVGRLKALLLQASRHGRSEEHTSELQSQSNLVCRLLLEKKKKKSDSVPIR